MTVAAYAHGRAQNVGASVVDHVTMQRQSLKRPKRSRCDGAAGRASRGADRDLTALVNGIPRLRGESASRSHCKSRAAWSSARRGYVRCSVDRRVGIDPLSWPDWQPSAARFNLEDPHASPRNSAKARFTATMVRSSRCPKAGPNLPRDGVCGLSTMICDDRVRPLRLFGSIGIRRSGASISVLVIGITVMAGSSAKWSAYTTRADRGLPCSPHTATVTRWPRLTPSNRWHPSCRPRHHVRHRPDRRRPGSDGPAACIPERTLRLGCRALRSAQAVAPPPSACRDAVAHAALRFQTPPSVTRGASRITPQ